jgi:hypothetical protein
MKGPVKNPYVPITILDRNEKIRNAVCFFALEHEKFTGRPLAHTFLHKYLAFLDYATLEKTGRPALGLLSNAIGKGPLPLEGDESIDERVISIPRGEGKYIVIAVGKPDMSWFSPFEQTEMKRLVEIYGPNFAKFADSSTTGFAARSSLREDRHERRTMVGQKADHLDNSRFTKQKEVHMSSGLHLLTEKYVNQLKELETRMADIKHKLEIVMEASRLLDEEGLADDNVPGLSGEHRTF